MSVKRLLPSPVRHDARFCALVLAAGAGRRFGGAKLTAPFRGGVLLHGALASAFAAPAAEVLVTTGADPGVEGAARAWAGGAGEAGRLRVVPTADWAAGLSASLRAGLTAAPVGSEAAFVFLGDMPDVPAEVAWRLAERWSGEVDALEPTEAGEAGHPVLLSRRLWGAAMALTGDRGARGLLRAEGISTFQVEGQAPGVRLDVDTPAALASLHAIPHASPHVKGR